MSIAGFDMKAYEGDLDEDMAEAGNSCSTNLSVAPDLRQNDTHKIVFCERGFVVLQRQRDGSVSGARRFKNRPGQWQNRKFSAKSRF